MPAPPPVARMIETREPLLCRTAEEQIAAGIGAVPGTDQSRSGIVVPIIGRDRVLGFLSMEDYEHEGAYGDAELRLLQTVAASMGVALENARLFDETQQALERQTATAEVLQVISGSMADPGPVFEKILDSCERLIACSDLAVLTVDQDGMVHLGSTRGSGGRKAARNFKPTPLAQTIVAQAVRERRVMHYPDALQGDGVPEVIRRMATRIGNLSCVVAPMMWQGSGVGAFFVVRSFADRTWTTFTAQEIALLETFAGQAVIAIQNARLFNDTKEALDQQRASSEVLGAISSSIADTKPVFDIILQRCQHLFEGDTVGLTLLRDDGMLDIGAYAGPGGDGLRQVFPQPLDRTTASGISIIDRTVLSYADVDAGDMPAASRDGCHAIGLQSMTFAPMLSSGRAIGTLWVGRAFKGAFSDKQVALLRTFADQAVIAIQNARLFNETQEALARQTATAEILSVISHSPTDVQPVFDAIVGTALNLLACDMTIVLRRDGNSYYPVAGTSREDIPFAIGSSRTPIDPGATFPSRVFVDKAMMHIPDWSAIDLPEHELRVQKQLGMHASLLLPLVRDGECIAVLAFGRVQAGAFDEAQIAIAKSFADQALIAIENVRLFNDTKEALAKVEERERELTESLDYQTAISDVLRCISESPMDVAPVFKAILESATRLFDSPLAAVFRYDGQRVHLVATHNWSPEAIEDSRRFYPGPPNPTMMSGRVVMSGRVQTQEDTLLDPGYDHTGARLGHWRRMLGAPLMKDGVCVGALVVAWPDPGTTPQRQIDLLQTFADQAVIAIENVRLINETREALERQTATADVLKVISESPTDVQPVFDVIAERAARLTGAEYGWVFRLDGDLIHVASSHGVNAQGIEAARQAFPMRPGAGSATARAVRDGVVVNIGDSLAVEDAEYKVKSIAKVAGFRSVLSVPMRREHQIVGVITVTRAAVGEFAGKEVDLLQTFARQAVIAIENVRLFNETREALEQQTATAEVLQVIGSSVADTAPVFDKILDSCQRLFATEQLGIFLARDDGQVHVAAWRGAALEAIARTFPKPVGETMTGQVIRDRRTIHIPDTAQMSDQPAAVRGVISLSGDASVAWAPMLWEDRGVGSICAMRQPPEPFTEKELALLKTFGDQAVIAIQNARLFNETKEALRAPDRDRRSAARDQRIADRCPAGARHRRQACRPAVPGRGQSRLAHRRRPSARNDQLRSWVPGQRRRAAAAAPHLGRRARRARAPDDPRRRRRAADRRGVSGHPRAAGTLRFSHGTQRAVAARRRARGRDLDAAQRGAPLPSCRDRPGADLCQPIGDRDRERAPVRRDQGSARAADRDGRNPAGHQRVRHRNATGV